MQALDFNDTISEEWDSFVKEHPYGWFWYTTSWMQYCQVSSFNISTKNVSFYIIENNKICAIVPLLLQWNDSDKEFSIEILYGGWPTPVPLISPSIKLEKSNQIQNYIFTKIDEIAIQHKVSKSHFRIYHSYLAYLNGDITYNFLMKFSYNNVSLNTQIIDLKSGTEAIIANCTKGCKYNIKSAIRSSIISPRVYDSNNIDPSIFKLFKSFYFSIAGKTTRPLQAFECLYKMLVEGQAFLLFLYENNTLIGVQYNIIFKQGSYYLMSAINKNSHISYLGTSLQWHSIQYLINKGFLYFEMGWQQFSDTLYDFPSKKERDISFFKRSFGGITVPLFSGEKYYNSNHFKYLLKERVEKFIINNYDKNGYYKNIQI